jgi:ATP/maltotriose-dependent transcriptional regulator MalT
LILTRSDPPLPLPRLRAHNDLYELHAADLRFSLEETRTFLGQALPFPLSPEAITRLEARTEGWVAGLRLLTLALQGRKDARDLEHMLLTFTGGHRHILEYLVADVLSSQQEDLQEFLLQTAFLTRLTGSLCNAVTGRNDCEALLEQLDHANLFLIPLDDVGQWYRYHALFAEAMQHEARLRLGEDYLRSLYDKASRWYEEHGLIAEAVEVALTASDFARAAELIERIVGPQSGINELHTLLRWVEQLPKEVLQSHPALSMAYAIALLFTLDRSDPATSLYIQAPLEMAERYWQAEDNRHKLGEVLALRSQLAWWQGDLSQAFAAARRALELPLEQETLWSGTVMLAVGMEETLAGKLDAAQQVALEARSFFEAVENPYGARAATYILGEVSSRRGDLHEAARFYRQEFAEAAEDPLDMATALICLAALSYEWNELQRAEQEVSQAFDLGKHRVNEIGKYHAEQVVQVPGSLVLARVLYARGEIVQAQRLLQEMVVLTQERRWPHLHREVLACQAQISISAGDLAAVQRWSTTIALLGEDFRLVQQEREALIVSRLLIARGEAGESLRLLDRWQAEAHAQGRTRSELEIQVLTALAHFACKHLPMARQTLREALALAQAEGYQRLFLDEGEAMATLLRAVLLDMREEALITYVQNLLRAFPQMRVGQGGSPPAVSALLIEPLSAQEQRVLRLLAAGRSNQEIAQELIVSVNTVKTQLQSIYRKLNAKSRMEASEAARRLKLL